LLVLDEPVAALDPVAKHDFMAAVLAAASAGGVSVLLSSHALAELERVASYLVLLARGRVRLAGHVDDLLAVHGGASLEQLALSFLRENVTEVAK
jgi:ABC-2 type transport system ATP-binding protein